SNRKGVALLLTIGMLLMAVILANVVLTLMLSHSRLTQHQVGRIQAYYAGMAGVNMAIDNLINNPTGWDPAGGANTTHTICNTTNAACPAGSIDEPDFFTNTVFTGSAVQRVDVTVRQLTNAEGNIPAGSREVTAVAIYLTRTTELHTAP
ncbi:MAG: hypothetical protein PHY94_07275, partial [Candidatus Omnitrophica bacterium]|nr:hypothetical protein [Candidatus Omnitrophota bacterium]